MYLAKHIKQPKGPQRFLTKITGLKSLSYQDRLKALSLYSVSYGLLHGGLCLPFWVVTIPDLLHLHKTNGSTNTQTKDLNLLAPY